ncbi:MAG: DMT family transporter [Pseudomonadota bacterium]
MAEVQPASAPVRGIALKCASVAIFSVMAAAVKAAQAEVPAGEAVFFRAFLALPVVVAYAWARGRLAAATSTRNLRAHAIRGVIGAAGMGVSFTALGLLPLPEVIAIGFAAPLLATVMAVFLLGEVVRAYRWSAVFIGLIGVIVMIWPRLTVLRDGFGSDLEAIGTITALVAAFLMALAQIHVRWLARTEPVLAIVFWFHVSCSLGALLTLPFGWVWPSAEVWLLLIVSGVFGGTAQIFLTESYRHADASTVAPFDYTSMIYGLLIGYFIFGEAPEVAVLLGASIVIGAGLFILWRERQLGILAERKEARRAMPPQG